MSILKNLSGTAALVLLTVLALVGCQAATSAAPSSTPGPSGGTNTGTGTGTAAAFAGFNVSFFLKSDATLWAAGDDFYGQLGDGNAFTTLSKPAQVMSSVTSVAVGSQHTLFLKADGTLWAVGNGYYGQLGNGKSNTAGSLTSPTQVATGVKAVAAGESYSMILKTDGTLWATGRNNNGQLGDGTLVDKSTPVQVMAGVAAVAVGTDSTLILKTDGTLWGCGSNANGQLGDGTQTRQPTPVQVLASVGAVAAGRYDTLAVKTDGTLWATGYNHNGELGLGNATQQISFVPVTGVAGAQAVAVGTSASQLFTMVVKTDGTLLAAGWNAYGVFGNGTVDSSGSAYQKTFLQVATGVRSVGLGSSHIVLTKTDSTFASAGLNSSGQLGDGTKVDKSTAVAVSP